MTATFTPQNLAAELAASTAQYFDTRVAQIERVIRAAFRNRADGVWITFKWNEGNYEAVIKHFEDNGFNVGSPSGNDGVPETSFFFSWDVDATDL